MSVFEDLAERGQKVIDRNSAKFEELDWKLHRVAGQVVLQVRHEISGGLEAAAEVEGIAVAVVREGARRLDGLYHDSLAWLKLNVLPF